LKGLAPPHPDIRDPRTKLSGCLARFALSVVIVDRTFYSGMKCFVLDFVKLNFEPIPVGYDLSFEHWLDQTSYTYARKQELTSVMDLQNFQLIKPRDLRVKGHMKPETYVKYKQARGINSREDAFKCFSGPYFKAMEHIVYGNPSFIKNVPVCERPRYIVDRLGSLMGFVIETDYSHYESHFIPVVLRSIEFVLYRYLLSNFPSVSKVILKALGGINKCDFGDFRIDVLGKRMSGEMCTSLGNGFTNLMLMMYMCKVRGGTCTGVVEGDDGLFVNSVELKSSDFKKIGWDIKLKNVTDLLSASFCGIVMSPSLHPLTDPRKVLLNFGWTHSALMHGGRKVLMGLLRAKALSLAYEHPNCPILWALAKRYIDLTEGYVTRWSANWYERQLEVEVRRFWDETRIRLNLGPDASDRVTFDREYSITPNRQVEIENYISTHGFDELDSPLILELFDHSDYDDAHDYYDRFIGRKA